MIDRIPNDFLIETELSAEQEIILIEQINRFNRLNNGYIGENELIVNNQGDIVFKKGTIIHGTSYYNEEMLDSISKSGIITGQAFGKGEDGETFYCADFFRVDRDMSVIEFADTMKKRKAKESFTPFSKENSTSCAFVIVPNDKMQGLISYDCYRSDTEESEITRSFVNYTPIEDREKGSSILYGVPASCFSMIVVGGKLLGDKNKIDYLIEKFPKCSIVSTYGELIYDANKDKGKDDEIVNLRREKAYLEKERRLNKLSNKNKCDTINKLNNDYRELVDAILKNCSEKGFLSEIEQDGMKMTDSFLSDQVIDCLFDVLDKNVTDEIFILRRKIVVLESENELYKDEISKNEKEIIELNNRYQRLMELFICNCSVLDIAKVFTVLGWQGDLIEIANKYKLMYQRNDRMRGIK